jgi:hypothetical protein
MKKIIVTTFIFFMFCCVCYANIFHVNVNGDDSVCNGSVNASRSSPPNCAFRTIQRGINVAQAGDLVEVHAGSYMTPLTSVRNGEKGKVIEIKANSNETVVIGRIKVLHSYIKINGFKITGFEKWVRHIDVNGAYVQIENNEFYSSSPTDYGGAVAFAFGESSSYGLLRGNIFDGKSANMYDKSRSIYIPIVLAGSNHTISNNLIRNMTDVERVFEFWGSNIVISNNEVYNLWQNDSNVSHLDIFQGFGKIQSKNILIEKNYFHDIQGQIGNFTADSPSSTGPWYVRNNIFANISSVLFLHMPSWNFHNNTFYKVGKLVGHPIMGAYAGADNFDVRNNIFFACGGGNSGKGFYTFQSGIADNNFTADETFGSVLGFYERNGINGGNPEFVFAKSECVNSTCDFSILSDSAVIDKGTVISSFNTDIEGTIRPQGKAWDIGAYEKSDDVNTISSPKNLKIINN